MNMSLSELRELVMDREAWRAAIHGVGKSRARLSDWTELNWVSSENNENYLKLQLFELSGNGTIEIRREKYPKKIY